MDMLSSRSYLELSQEQEISLNTRESRPEASEIPDQVTDRNSATSDRAVRKRGRPRLEAKDASAIEVDPDRVTTLETSLTSSTGTPSADPTGTTHLSS